MIQIPLQPPDESYTPNRWLAKQRREFVSPMLKKAFGEETAFTLAVSFQELQVNAARCGDLAALFGCMNGWVHFAAPSLCAYPESVLKFIESHTVRFETHDTDDAENGRGLQIVWGGSVVVDYYPSYGLIRFVPRPASDCFWYPWRIARYDTHNRIRFVLLPIPPESDFLDVEPDSTYLQLQNWESPLSSLAVA